MIKTHFFITINLLIAFAIFFSCTPEKPQHQDQGLLSVLYLQRAAEYKALTIQTYQLAGMMLEQAMRDKNWTAATEQTGSYQTLPPAVILDLDETVLDNSAYEVGLIKTETAYSSKTWNSWCEEARAKAIPGAIDFCNQADAAGITVFYVTNRLESQKKDTRKNLKKLGLPLQPDLETILPRTDSSDKGPRRAEIAKSYRILLQIGDNAGDFFSGFTHASLATRDSLVQAYNSNWGRRWIVLPNPVYGDWEAAMYNYEYGLSTEEKLSRKMNSLID